MASQDEVAIYMTLLLNPNVAYVTPDRTRVYVLHSTGTLIYHEGDFRGMNAADINKYIQDTLK